MLDLKLAELNTLAKNDRMAEKYMSELESLNEDPKFREYMTVEEDRRKCYNSDMRIAREEGIKQSKIKIAKSLMKSSMTIEEIVKHTGLTIDELEKLKEDIR